jgi:hypothetical protein
VEPERFEFYETSFSELRERLIRVLGSPTVNRLIDRAVVEMAQAHPQMSSLQCEDDDIFFEEVRRAYTGSADEDVRDGFMALSGTLLLLVARLLGREIAERLTARLTAAEYGRGGLIGQ